MSERGEPTTMVADNPEAGRYEIRVDGELAGAAQYELKDSTISFTHTEIDDRFEGRGLGSQLARESLDDARRRGLRVLPYCPFIRDFISKHDEYRNLVPENVRSSFSL
jgi:predicted GNAT family acetyltransferase